MMCDLQSFDIVQMRAIHGIDTQQDYPLMQGIFLFITLAVLAANWLVDLATWWLDARTRESAS